MRTTRTTRMLLAAAAVLALGATPGRAYVAGDGKGKPEADCLVGLEGYDDGDFSPFGKKGKPAIQCTDCDPSCDLDGVATANGSCTFSLAVRVNDADVSACTPAALKSVKASAKTKGTKITSKTSFQVVLDGTSATSAFVNFPVLVKGKNGDKPGTGKVSMSAKKLEKPKLKDKDKFTFVCNPLPVGEVCPGVTTTSTTIETTTTTTSLPLDDCGDGEPTGAEECDDGNPDPTDGCTNACTICGNGTTTDPEECDEGPGTCSAGDVGADCVNDVECDSAPEAGDGVCDLANDGTTCSPNCRLPGCGNGLVEVGETCDDGNTDDGDSCPSTCVIEACEANPGSDFSVDVTFAGSDEVAALTVFIDYPEGKVSIPGSGGSVPDGIITDLPGFAFSQVNDLDYAVRESVVDTVAFPQGLVFRIHFETCASAEPPTAGEFSCDVEVAGNENAEEIEGVTCAVAPTP